MTALSNGTNQSLLQDANFALVGRRCSAIGEGRAPMQFHTEARSLMRPKFARFCLDDKGFVPVGSEVVRGYRVRGLDDEVLQVIDLGGCDREPLEEAISACCMDARSMTAV